MANNKAKDRLGKTARQRINRRNLGREGLRSEKKRDQSPKSHSQTQNKRYIDIQKERKVKAKSPEAKSKWENLS